MAASATYCGHCAPCPAGIDIAMVNKLYDLATMQPEVPATVKAHYGALSATAADCIGLRRLRDTLSLWGACGGAHGKGQGAVWVSPAPRIAGRKRRILEGVTRISQK